MHELNRKAETAIVKTKASRKKLIEAAENAGVEPPELHHLAPSAMPRRDLAARPMEQRPVRPSAISLSPTAISCNQESRTRRVKNAIWRSTATSR
jgi:hypothetical protein